MREWTILNEPVEKHASKDFIIIEEEASVRDAAIQMRSRGHTCVLVARGGKPVGIVTERDILYRVVASGRDPNKVMLKEVMSSPLITVSPKTSLSEAMTLMATRGVRRLVVMEEGKPVGLLTLVALTGGLVSRMAILPEVEGEVVKCPYCGAKFSSPRELSKHIDSSHIGAEVLSRPHMEW